MYCINRRTDAETTEMDDSSEQKATQLEVLSLIEYFQQMLIYSDESAEMRERKGKMYVQHEMDRSVEQILTQEGQNGRTLEEVLTQMECALTAIE